MFKLMNSVYVYFCLHSKYVKRVGVRRRPLSLQRKYYLVKYRRVCSSHMTILSAKIREVCSFSPAWEQYGARLAGSWMADLLHVSPTSHRNGSAVRSFTRAAKPSTR